MQSLKEERMAKVGDVQRGGLFPFSTVSRVLQELDWEGGGQG